jgi:hypothetical protein
MGSYKRFQREQLRSRNLTNSRLIETLCLTDEDYKNLEKAFAIGGRITKLQPRVEVQIAERYMDCAEFESYLIRRRINVVGKAKKTPSGAVYANIGKIRLYSAKVAF